MIEHLRGRDRKLEPLGWTGQHAEWITLVCLHSGVFTRAQFCHYFNAQRMTASRFVNALVDRRIAVEGNWPLFNGGGKTCRISGNAIFRALGVENIRQRRRASKSGIMRRLLSLDFVLEHPGMGWLPTEAEKVEFFEKLGLPLRLLPRRIYYGVVGNQKRYFALKLPLAVDPETVSFAYVDPGHQTDRADRVLERWAEAEPGTPDEGLTAKQEIKAIQDAMIQNNTEFFVSYGGERLAMKRAAALMKMPAARLTEGVSIDDYSTWRAVRFADRDETG